jgi:hypothetical protein
MTQYKLDKYYSTPYFSSNYLNTLFVNDNLLMKDFINLISKNFNNIYIDNDMFIKKNRFRYFSPFLHFSKKFEYYKSDYISKMLELEKEHIYSKKMYDYEKDYISCFSKDIDSIIKKDVLDVCKGTYGLNKICLDNTFVSVVGSKILKEKLDFPYHTIYKKCYDDRDKFNG